MSVEQQVKSVQEMLLREMDKSKTIIFDGLLNNSMINNIPESLFVNYFLPYFIGNNTNNNNWVMEWISIAGSPMVEVGILKDNTNEVLYYVPSILNTNNVLLHKQDGDISDIFNRYEQINNNIPIQGLNFLIKALNSKNTELLAKVNFDEINKRWINIFQRYNIVTQSPGGQASPPTDSGDYFDI